MAEDEEAPTYSYEGERAPGESLSITAGEAPKVLSKDIVLLGERAGAGKATFPSGDSYEGKYEAGKRHGAGSYVYAAPKPGEDEEPKPPRGQYDGTFAGGLKDGVGTMAYGSGHKYQGTWKAGLRDGEGAMFYPNGDIYTGSWLAGKKHGAGSYIFKESETRVAGTWEHDKLVSGRFMDKFGNAYDGDFEGSTDAVEYTAGGKFTLASGATALAAPTLPAAVDVE